MNNNDPQLQKQLHSPASKYDYDGITGTWLLIPARIHLLLLAISLPVIIWVLPNMSFKGEFRYILADYKYYFAAAFALFCIASALLSILKAQQVKSRIRPTNRVGAQIIAKAGPGRPASPTKRVSTPPNLGHVRRNNAEAVNIKSATASQNQKKLATQDISEAKPLPADKKVRAKAPKKEQPLAKKSVPLPATIISKKVTSPKSSTSRSTHAKKEALDTPPSQPKKRTQKKPEQMKLDI